MHLSSSITPTRASSTSRTSFSALRADPCGPLRDQWPSFSHPSRFFQRLASCGYFPDAHITSKRVINAARELFINVGVPIKYWSDGGPQFPSAEFKQFQKEWGVSLGVSSPHFHQSNGVVEAGIKSMKKLIAGSFTSNSFDINKFGQSLLLFRNTAISGGQSPAQIVFNRPMRD